MAMGSTSERNTLRLYEFHDHARSNCQSWDSNWGPGTDALYHDPVSGFMGETLEDLQEEIAEADQAQEFI